MKKNRLTIGALPIPDDAVDGALTELVRLAREARTRFRQGRHVSAMASLTAIDPLKSLVVDQLNVRWALEGVDGPDDTPAAGPSGYL